MSRVPFFTAFLVVISCLHEGQSSTTIWRKLNLHDVCFEGKGDRPGHVLNYGDSKLIGAVKLVFKSGSIRCSTNEAFASRWGCYQTPSLIEHPLNVIITDKNRKKIYPLDQYIIKNRYRTGLWYYLPFTDSLHSDELVFSNYMDPFYFPKHGQLSIWYGEDLKNWYEGDNIGRVCVDVYVHALL